MPRNDDFVTLRALAEELGIERSNLRKFALKNGYVLHRIRSVASRNQLELAVTTDDAAKLRRERSEYARLR